MGSAITLPPDRRIHRKALSSLTENTVSNKRSLPRPSAARGVIKPLSARYRPIKSSEYPHTAPYPGKFVETIQFQNGCARSPDCTGLGCCRTESVVDLRISTLRLWASPLANSTCANSTIPKHSIPLFGTRNCSGKSARPSFSSCLRNSGTKLPGQLHTLIGTPQDIHHQETDKIINMRVFQCQINGAFHSLLCAFHQAMKV